MLEKVVLSFVSILLILYFRWGFSSLPSEKWQILAALPSEKTSSQGWQGTNLTWYGLLTANAYLVAVAVFLVLMASVGVSTPGALLLVVALLGCCVPASRLVARIVEKKAHTFTVGGAVFVGILVAPLLIALVNRYAGPVWSFRIPAMATCAAMAIAYSFGEGLGRLACISFGCCYGKPLSSCSGWLRQLFEGRCFTYFGSTKKIAYAGGLEGTQVIPIQAVTSVLYTLCGLLATGLYLAGHFSAAFLITIITTQLWRSLSETLRADYRGEGRISAYQVMGMVAVAYSIATAVFFPVEKVVTPELALGLVTLWSPPQILFLQAVWLVIFLFTGLSTVTGATLSFHVHQDRI
ncbi:MAG: prolipoprotein diacylglyceryl transferase [Desulfuromonadales bacterium]|nr:prolipoprotein diacylglyceryl transferase [Desulfuromonadales bacterium]